MIYLKSWKFACGLRNASCIPAARGRRGAAARPPARAPAVASPRLRLRLRLRLASPCKIHVWPQKWIFRKSLHFWTKKWDFRKSLHFWPQNDIFEKVYTSDSQNVTFEKVYTYDPTSDIFEKVYTSNFFWYFIMFITKSFFLCIIGFKHVLFSSVLFWGWRKWPRLQDALIELIHKWKTAMYSLAFFRPTGGFLAEN